MYRVAPTTHTSDRDRALTGRRCHHHSVGGGTTRERGTQSRQTRQRGDNNMNDGSGPDAYACASEIAALLRLFTHYVVTRCFYVYGVSGSTSLFGWCVVLLYWLFLLVPLGCLIGLACAAFLWSIDFVTHARFTLPWLLYLLPVAGVSQAMLYAKWGQYGGVTKGVDLIIEQIHVPDLKKGRATIPTRMGALVWIATVVTHLCGGSAGREGTALQVACSISNFYSRVVRRLSRNRVSFDRRLTRLVTISSIAAGFGGVFGTPFAGVVFALEVLSIGSMATEAMVPCCIATITATLVCNAGLEVMGIAHTHCPHQLSGVTVTLNLLTLSQVALTGIAAGFVSLVFSSSIHGIKSLYKRLLPGGSHYAAFLPPCIGGIIVICMVFIFNTRDYLGIGTIAEDDSTITIATCFQEAGPCYGYSFALKLLFTVVTLSAGFKGGEVTCLFSIGASLGWGMAQLVGRGVDTPFFAAVGFVSVFSGAANTPLASSIMACELFGGEQANAIYYAMACYLSYAVSGASGIYHAQTGRSRVNKMGHTIDVNIMLKRHHGDTKRERNRDARPPHRDRAQSIA